MELSSPTEASVSAGEPAIALRTSGRHTRRSSSGPGTSDQVSLALWLLVNNILTPGLISMGLTPGSHSMVGIYSRNCPEWIVAEQGVYSHSMILVPLYDSLGPDARSYVISECEMRLVIAQDEESLTNILNSAPPCLKVIVTIKDVKPRIVEEATSLGLKIVRFVEIEKYGAANLVEEEPPSPSTIATICFSRLSPIKNSPESKPKGVMLSHEVIHN